MTKFKDSEEGSQNKFTQIASFTDSYRSKSRNDLLTKIEYFENILDDREKARLVGQAMLKATSKSRKKTIKKTSKIDLKLQPSPSKDQTPIIVTLDEAGV